MKKLIFATAIALTACTQPRNYSDSFKGFEGYVVKNIHSRADTYKFDTWTFEKPATKKRVIVDISYNARGAYSVGDTIK